MSMKWWSQHEMINLKANTKCIIDYTADFNKQLKKIVKQGKDTKLLQEIITKLDNKEELEIKNKNHPLINDKTYRDCMECHIKPDWLLLVYKYINNNLILLLVSTGSHSELFKK